MKVPCLRDELIRRGFVIRTDASHKELVKELFDVLATEQRRNRRSPMSSQRGSPMDVDHTPGG